MPLSPLSKYQTKWFTFTPALQRARKPWRTTNALGGIILFGFAAAVYSYSIFAIKQDDFSDVLLPPLPSTPSSNSSSTENNDVSVK